MQMYECVLIGHLSSAFLAISAELASGKIAVPETLSSLVPKVGRKYCMRVYFGIFVPCVRFERYCLLAGGSASRNSRRARSHESSSGWHVFLPPPCHHDIHGHPVDGTCGCFIFILNR